MNEKERVAIHEIQIEQLCHNMEKVNETLSLIKESMIKLGVFIKIMMGGVGIGLLQELLKHYKMLGF